jgi:nucleoside-diphosphate kinase
VIAERCLLIFKPDLVANRHHVASALIRVVSYAPDLIFITLQRLTITRTQAERLYEVHVGQSYHERNVEFMTSGSSVAMVLDGDDACSRLRILSGPTDPFEARRRANESLRAQFGTMLPRNAVHASENARDAEREIGIFFPQSKPLDYRDVPWK